MENEIANLGNRADQVEERISDIDKSGNDGDGRES